MPAVPVPDLALSNAAVAVAGALAGAPADAAKLAVAAAVVSASLPSEGAGRLVPCLGGAVVIVLALAWCGAAGRLLMSSDSGLTVETPVSR